MTHLTDFEIHDTFRITGRGILFAGKLLTDGHFKTGDTISFEFNEQLLERKIKGIDNGMRVKEGEPNVGLLIETLNEREIIDLKNWEPNLTVAKIYTQ